MKNYIGLNISYLCNKNKLNHDDFGLEFGLKRGVVGTYVREVSNPKIEVIQKICSFYQITIDNFVNKDLSIPQPNGFKDGNILYTSEQENTGYQVFSPKYVELLEKSIEDKNKIILTLEEKLEIEKSKTA